MLTHHSTHRLQARIQPVTSPLWDGLSNRIEEREQQDIDGPQARLSPLLSERHCSLEGTMGKGQEKGGSIVPASCWM